MVGPLGLICLCLFSPNPAVYDGVLCQEYPAVQYLSSQEWQYRLHMLVMLPQCFQNGFLIHFYCCYLECRCCSIYIAMLTVWPPVVCLVVYIYILSDSSPSHFTCIFIFLYMFLSSIHVSPTIP